MSINWRQITDCREKARHLVASIREAGPAALAILESFEDWPRLSREIVALASPRADAKLLSLGDVIRATGVTADAIPTLVARGEFPGPFFDEPDMLWLASDVAAWKKERHDG
jgi:predicted DNA-binding transcriptional regulator AlpA